MLLRLTMEELKLGLDLLTVIAATIAFFVGLWQYQRAQLWKRLEFVAAEITAFNSDWRARNAMLMLDWGSRKLALFREETSAERREVFVDRKLLSSTLLTHDKVTRLFTDQEAAIRDCFDAFLGYFDRFDLFVEAGLVQVADFKPYLQYWIETLNTELDPAIQLLLSQYIAFYRFDAA